jgi:hypothetical protein
MEVAVDSVVIDDDLEGSSWLASMSISETDV